MTDTQTSVKSSSAVDNATALLQHVKHVDWKTVLTRILSSESRTIF